jgi:Carboxypeptidase regulatory-like domain
MELEKMKNLIKNNRGKLALGLSLIFATFFAMFAADRFNLESFSAKANTYYFELVGGAPMIQTWTNLAQIVNDDDWTGVISIQGYRGTGLTSIVGGSPTAVLGDSASTDQDVTANQTNTFNTTFDGVAEFHLANPTVALKASDFASAPNLVLHLDSSRCSAGKAIRISYVVRDIDNSPIDAVQPVSLQYRVGMTGNYANVLFTTIADATSGIGQATQSTPVFATLPNAVAGQVFDVRIITSNAAGIDEWVGIDDIKAECIAATAASSGIRGRAVSSSGRGISRAQISLTNATTNQTAVGYTNQLGYFNFQDLTVGDVYVISIDHKKYTFEVPSQTFQLQDELNGLEFRAN